MYQHTRRSFLADVGKGMLVASLGSSLAPEFGASSVFADGDEPRLTFGRLEPMVALLQETPVDRLLPILVDRLRQGTSLTELVSAASLANARTFGGEHYEGFHTFMALAPAYRMASELPRERQALPVLKVLYRNSVYIGRVGGRSNEKLRPIDAPQPNNVGESQRQFRQAIWRHEVQNAEQAFAALSHRSADNTLNDVLQFNIEDHPGVHEVVLAWRAWEMLDIVGREHAHTFLRQSVRQCSGTTRRPNEPDDPQPSRVMALLERHNL